jgi:hypothetical protein
VRFIPVDFSKPYPAVPQANPCAALHLPPVAFAIQASEPCDVAYSPTGRDREFSVGLPFLVGEFDLVGVLQELSRFDSHSFFF